MPGEKRKRKHSHQIQETDSTHNGNDIKKRKKGKEGKEKRRRKHETDVVKEAPGKVLKSVNAPVNAAEKVEHDSIKEVENDNVRKGERKKKKKHSKSQSDDKVETSSCHSPEKPSREAPSGEHRPSPKTDSPDKDPRKVDVDLNSDAKKDNLNEKREGIKKKKKKKKKERQRSELRDEEPDIKSNKSTAQQSYSGPEVTGANVREHKQTDKPDANGVTEQPTSANPKSSASRQPASPTEIATKKPSGATTTEPSDQPEDDEKPLDDKRLPRTLFVGNVPQTATRKQLRKIFSEYSPVETIRIRNVIPANPKIPKKAALLANRLAKFSNSFSAYVVFKEATDIEQVLQKAVDGTNMTLCQDHHLRVSKALHTKGKRRQSVFVGNLPFDCTDEELITAFMPVAKECGVRLMNVRVNRDSDTGVGRGVGFVTFDDIMGIQASLNKTGEVKIRGRVVRIERAFKTKNMKSKSYKRKRNTAFGQSES